MTSKKHRQAIDAALSNALDPPRRWPSPQLDSLLSEYAPPPESVESRDISPSQSAGHDEKTIDLWASITDLHTGYLRLYGVIVEKIYRHLDPTEQAVYTQLYALSWGYGNPSCRVSLPRLAERAGMGQTAAHKPSSDLQAREWLRSEK